MNRIRGKFRILWKNFGLSKRLFHRKYTESHWAEPLCVFQAKLIKFDTKVEQRQHSRLDLTKEKLVIYRTKHSRANIHGSMGMVRLSNCVYLMPAHRVDRVTQLLIELKSTESVHCTLCTHHKSVWRMVLMNAWSDYGLTKDEFNVHIINISWQSDSIS